MLSHPSWSSLYEILVIALGVLDGLSPQTWNAPGQIAGNKWFRTLRGGASLTLAMILLTAFGVWLDSSVSLGMAHPIFAIAAGVILIGLAASSTFALIADYAMDPMAGLRPMNLFGRVDLGRTRWLQEFIPTPAALAALFAALDRADVADTIRTLFEYTVFFSIGTVAVAALERKSATGTIERPSFPIEQIFDYTPMFSNAIVVLMGGLIMHSALEADSVFMH